MFDLSRIHAETFVNRVDFHSELGSTNERAMELARTEEGLAPLLVLTERQTAGRGRGANRWWSVDGSLTFSLLLTDHIRSLSLQAVPQLALTAGLAVCEALRETVPGLDIGLKWPNDVYLGRQHKISGILIEISPSATRTGVIGIGINVNNSFQQAPSELRSNATSLMDGTGEPLDLSGVLIAVLQKLEAQLALLITDPAELQRRWQQRCILTGHSVRVAMGSKEIHGICQGIDGQGSLVIATGEGRVTCASGMVREFA